MACPIAFKNPSVPMDNLKGYNNEAPRKHDVLKDYAFLMRSMHDCVYLLNLNRIIVNFVQPEHCSGLIQGNGLLQHHLSDVPLPLEIIAEFEEKLAIVEKSNSTEHIKFTINTPKGLNTFNASIAGVFSGNKTLHGFIIIVRDLTQTVLQQNKFLSILDKYNLAVKSANFGIWEFDYMTGEFYWDTVMEQFFNCKLVAIHQFEQWIKLVNPRDAPQLVKSFSDARKAGADFHAEFSVNVDGVTKYIETFATFKYNAKTGWSEKVTGIALDVTGKKTTAISLKKSEEHYRMLADNSSDIIVFHQADGTVNYLSPSSVRILGNTFEEAREKGGIFYIHPDDISTVLLHNKAAFEGNDTGVPYECRIQHRDGHWINFEIVNKAVRDENGKVTGILSTSRDISARKAAEEHYRMLADNISDIVGVINLDGVFEYVSPSVERLLGYTQQDVTGRNPFDIIHPDDILPLQQQTMAKNLQGQEGSYTGYRVKHKLGHWVYFDISSKPIYDSQGKITHILKSSRDITQRVLAEQARNLIEQQYKMLADNIADLVILISPGFKRLYVSPSSLTLTGYTPEELLGSKIEQLIHRDDIEAFYHIFNTTILKGEDHFVHTPRMLHKNGNVLFVKSRVKAIRNANGELTNMLATIQDITKQHEAEEARLATEQHYRLLADNIGDFVILDTPDFKRLYVSPSGTALTGYTTEELLNNRINQVMHPNDLPVYYEAIKNTIFKGDNQLLFNNRLVRKDGQIIFVQSVTRAIRNNSGELQNLLIIVRDISKQQKAESALRKSEEQYRMLADNIGDFVILLTPQFERLYVSPSGTALCGYSTEELLHSTVHQMLHADDLPLFFNTVDTIISKGANHAVFVGRILHKNGQSIYTEAVIKAIRNDNGRLINILSTIRDISKQHDAETALRSSEEQYRMLADNMSDMITLTTAEFTRLYVSPSSFNLTGYTAEELIGQPAISLIHPDDIQYVMQTTVQNISAGVSNFTCNYRGLHKSGKMGYVSSVITVIHDGDGGIKHLLSITRDITNEKLAQIALTDSEEKYRMLADNMSDLVILYAPDLTKRYISPSCKHFTGYTQEEALQIAPGELVFIEDRERFKRQATEMFSTGQSNFTINHRGAQKNGSWRYMSSYFNVIRDETGTIQNTLVTVRDVHAETIAKKALTDSEEKYRMLADNIFDTLILLTPQFKRLYVSPSALQLTGYTAEELMHDQNLLSTVYKEDFDYIFNRITGNIKENNDRFVCKYRLKHKNGQLLYVSSQATVLRDLTGQVKNIIITTRDITPEKTAQMLLANSEEKYRSLVEASENIVLMMDENGQYLFANAIACKYVQKEISEVVGKTIYDFFDKAAADYYVDKIKTVLNTNRATTFEYNIKVPGTAVWLRNTLNPIFNSAGNAYAVMLSLVDFTEIKTYSEKLRVQNEELKQIAHLQSHIVRAPLANIEGILSLVNEQDMSDENRALMQLLKKSALQLDSIVTDIVTKAINVKHATQA